MPVFFCLICAYQFHSVHERHSGFSIVSLSQNHRDEKHIPIPNQSETFGKMIPFFKYERLNLEFIICPLDK